MSEIEIPAFLRSRENVKPQEAAPSAGPTVDPAPTPQAPPSQAARSGGAPQHAAGQLKLPDGIRAFGGRPNGARRAVGVVVSRFNGEITQRLLDAALEELERHGVMPEAIEVMPVPGAFELPLGAMALARSRRYSCVVALGCVIRGDTPHFEFVSAEAASGVQLAALETGVPVAFGVLTCDNVEQALARAGGAHGNKGAEAARSALEMAESLAQLRASLSS